MPVDWRGFYAIVDPEYCKLAPLEVTDAVLRGGCAVVQLRAKHWTDRDLLGLARSMRAKCADAGVPFVMNDRLDLALLAGADGLHLGQEDLGIEDARKHFSGVIGVSTHDIEQARTAVRSGADLIGFGPVASTASKVNPDPVVGMDGLAACCTEVNVPVVAIGGLCVDLAADATRSGAELVAAISAVCASHEPESQVRAFVGALS